MRESHAYDRDMHEPGSTAAEGRCSYHADGRGDRERCTEEAVVSYQDRDDRWQSGCSAALEELVEREEIEPLGQGA